MIRLCIAVMLSFSGSAALADCSPFTLVTDGSARKVNFVDAGNDGPGDMRIGYREVALDGAPKGQMHWTKMVLDKGDEPRTISTYFWTLDDGDIQASDIANTRAAANISKPSATDSESIMITGGTGVYTHASGIVSSSFDGHIVSYSFEIACKE